MSLPLIVSVRLPWGAVSLPAFEETDGESTLIHERSKERFFFHWFLDLSRWSPFVIPDSDYGQK